MVLRGLTIFAVAIGLAACGRDALPIDHPAPDAAVAAGDMAAICPRRDLAPLGCAELIQLFGDVLSYRCMDRCQTNADCHNECISVTQCSAPVCFQVSGPLDLTYVTDILKAISARGGCSFDPTPCNQRRLNGVCVQGFCAWG